MNNLVDTMNSTDADDNNDEELDPRIQFELETLNAATDGINHLETEFGEAQTLFQQMMDDATFQLQNMHQQLGKSVDKSRPYYEALKQAKISHNQLHQAALKFEQAQTRHFNAKKRVIDAERRAFSGDSRRINPALQEVLNQVTIEVMEASSASQTSWEKHSVASQEYEEKQKTVQDLYKSLRKHIRKSRPYYDLKMNLNKQLEIQKQRLEKIQEGIQCSKDAYSETLHNLEVISDDIHRARKIKKNNILTPPCECIGSDSGKDASVVHSCTMENIRSATLTDTIKLQNDDDSESTDSDASSDNILDSNLYVEDNKDLLNKNGSVRISVILEEDLDFSKQETRSSPIARSRTSSIRFQKRRLEKSMEDITLAVNEDLKELSSKVDDSYEVITSHSIPPSPPPFDVLDGGERNSCSLSSNEKTKSYADLTRFDYMFECSDDYMRRRHSEGNVNKKPHTKFMKENTVIDIDNNNTAATSSTPQKILQNDRTKMQLGLAFGHSYSLDSAK